MGLAQFEKEAVLALFPYMSKDPVIFDVGSNRGYWSDVVINRCGEIHLFEPNDHLLTYTKVKYNYHEDFKIQYISGCVYSTDDTITLYRFLGKHDGLSNVIDNKKWDLLFPANVQVPCVRIDTYCRVHRIKTIDFLKIDVEGAEKDVLLGAHSMLVNNNIKFIQIEKSEHYDFSFVPDYVRGFDYDVFHFDGKNFVKWTNQEAENLYIMDKDFTQNWNSEFIKNTEGIRVNFALEIGCFEGLTTNYICDNMLNDGGRIICIDPLTDEYLPEHPDNEMFVGQYKRFIRNTKGQPVELIRKKSRDVYKDEQFRHYRFDFIYVDGDHTEEEVYNDAVNSFQLLRVNGHILFDDYEWREETARGIDKFLKQYSSDLKIVKKGYQVLIQKL